MLQIPTDQQCVSYCQHIQSWTSMTSMSLLQAWANPHVQTSSSQFFLMTKLVSVDSWLSCNRGSSSHLHENNYWSIAIVCANAGRVALAHAMICPISWKICPNSRKSSPNTSIWAGLPWIWTNLPWKWKTFRTIFGSWTQNNSYSSTLNLAVQP